MADCRIVNAATEAAVSGLATAASSYNTAGETFITNLTNALAEMEGDSKDAFMEFVEQKAKEFITTGLGGMVQGMSDLLEANRSNFVDVDGQVAQAFRG